MNKIVETFPNRDFHILKVIKKIHASVNNNNNNNNNNKKTTQESKRDITDSTILL